MESVVNKLVIIDTDILIDVGRGLSQAIDSLNELQHHRLAAITSVTQMELIVGCQNKTELQKLDRFLTKFEVIHPSPSISQIAIKLIRQYRLSHNLRMPDALIAASAIHYDCELASKNQKDYRFIENLKLLPYPIKKLSV